jgi:Tfp pilus assembly protein PilW
MNPVHTEKQGGFTLVELMVAVTVGTLAVVLILSVYLAISTSLAASADYREMHHEVRHAMDRLRKDITGGSAVSQHTASSLLAVTTTAGGSTNPVSVVYALANHQLSRTVASGTPVILATGVDQVLFTLYDESGVDTASLTDACSVGVKIEIERQGVRNTYEDVLETRNRMRRKGL